jgi:hypothetical protein
MLTIRIVRRDPGDCREGAVLGGLEVVGEILDVLELIILLDGIEAGQRVQETRSSGLLGDRCATHPVVLAVSLGPPST